MIQQDIENHHDKSQEKKINDRILKDKINMSKKIIQEMIMPFSRCEY